MVKPWLDNPNVSSRWDDIVAWIQPMVHRRTFLSIVGKLMIAASSYFLWQERNNAIFKRGERRVAQVRDAIIEVVRLKLLTIRFKKTASVARLKTL